MSYISLRFEIMPFHQFFKILFLLTYLFLTACQGFQFDPWPETQYGIYHTVQKGQTLYRIAQVYEIDMEVLSRANYIRDVSKIKVGTQLWVPGARRVLSIPTTSTPSDSSRFRSTNKKNIPTVRPRKGILIWPTKGTLTSGFGNRDGRRHEGIDIAAPKGTPINAAAAGEVVFSGWGPTGYGKMVILEHKNHLTTVYAHNSKILVKKGARVKQGQRISLMGSTGRSTGPHLHFEVRNDTEPKNPVKYLPVKR